MSPICPTTFGIRAGSQSALHMSCTEIHEPVIGSDEWWNQALAASKAYMERSAVHFDTFVAQDDAENDV